jgi:hypothetical protein
MSQLAVSPCRIKRSHRRRWKRTTGHRFYILNNPLSGTDPTGYKISGSICGIGSNDNARGCDTGSADTTLPPVDSGTGKKKEGSSSNGAKSQSMRVFPTGKELLGALRAASVPQADAMSNRATPGSIFDDGAGYYREYGNIFLGLADTGVQLTPSVMLYNHLNADDPVRIQRLELTDKQVFGGFVNNLVSLGTGVPLPFRLSAATKAAPAAGLADDAVSASTKTVVVSETKYPESAAHIRQAQAEGKPATLTVDRSGAAANRRASLGGVERRKGLDRDEYPPAMFQEGGKGASVKYVTPADNRGAGACIGAQCRGLPNGSKVEIKVGP